MASRGRGAPRTSRPTRCAHGVRVQPWRALADMVRGVVGADVPGGPRTRWRPRGRPRGRGARGTSRPTMGCTRACGVVGADVPGGPRTRWRFDGIPMRAARRGRRARPWGARGCGVVGADVPGGPRPRWRPRGRGAPGSSRLREGCHFPPAGESGHFRLHD